MEGSGIPKSWAPGVPVGQGIFKGSKNWSEEETSKLINRCHLFRPKNPNGVGCSGWDGWSGAPVLVSTCTGSWEVLGFLSFSQPRGLQRNYNPVDDDHDLRSDISKGYVAFAACMHLPPALLEAEIIGLN